MLRCRSAARIARSCTNRMTALGCGASSSRSSFTATCALVFRSSARHTVPLAPPPICSISSYDPPITRSGP
jgi:hypothetical protein